MKFTLSHKAKRSNARTGTLQTAHGEIATPIFMPVGTVGSVKGISSETLKAEINAQIILGNTYHLYLRPGTDILKKAGGLHQFNNWSAPILTDSGGFQVFSLASNRKIKEEGVLFRSHIDGSKHLFTPERVMQIQRSIGADIMMGFDECPPYPAERRYVKASTARTHRWLDRCKDELKNSPALYGYEQTLFPIVQGGVYKDLRKWSVEEIAKRDCQGNAIGGVSVGEPPELMYEMTDIACHILPEDKPRYLMGVGYPWDILESISLGIDMFDCVVPTRNGRNGMLFTKDGIINIKNKKWATDFSAIDKQTPCISSQHYTKAYLRHLFMAKEILGMQLASIHNLCFYLNLVKQARQQILSDTFAQWKDQLIPKMKKRL